MFVLDRDALSNQLLGYWHNPYRCMTFLDAEGIQTFLHAVGTFSNQVQLNVAHSDRHFGVAVSDLARPFLSAQTPEQTSAAILRHAILWSDGPLGNAKRKSGDRRPGHQTVQ
jgi:hypothetical protein